MLLASGLCPDWEDWDPKKAKQNAQEAMDAAEKWLDVPQVYTSSKARNFLLVDLGELLFRFRVGG